VVTPAEGIALSVVIPCYNEGGNLDALAARCRAAAATMGAAERVEFVLVDNGSRDDSAARLAALAAGDARFVVATVRENIGYGHGILTGLAAARGAVLAWTHADLQTDVGDVVAAYARWRAAAEPQRTLVRGRRTGRAALDALFTGGMSVLASAALGVPLHDINAQPKLFPRAFLAVMTHPPADFSLDLYALYMARRAGWTVLEHPVHFGRRMAGEAKGGGTLRGKWRLIKRTAAYIVKLRAHLRAERA